MKRYLLVLAAALVVCTACLTAAEPITGADLEALTRRIRTASDAVRTLQGRFVQTKTLSLLAEDFRSEGRLYYARPQQVRWQYTAPYQYDFVLQGTQVTIRNEKANQTLDAAGNKMFRQLCNIISGCVDGSLLTTGHDFSIVWSRGEGEVTARLTPLNKPFKDLFSVIEIALDEADCTVRRIRMEESGGDTTLIVFSDYTINQPLDDATFHIQ